MSQEQITEHLPAEPKVAEYLKIKGVLANVGREFGFTASEKTNQAWNSIALATRYLDAVLDEGHHQNAADIFDRGSSYILGLGVDMPSEITDPEAQNGLRDAEATLAQMGYGERLAVKHTAASIQEADARIKQAKTPKDLERWRTIEGALTAELFINCVPLPERFGSPKFDEFAEYVRRFFALGNNLDSLADFKEDSGVTHQVEANIRNRTVFAIRSLGSLASVMKLRGPLRNPVATGRAIMAEAK